MLTLAPGDQCGGRHGGFSPSHKRELPWSETQTSSSFTLGPLILIVLIIYLPDKFLLNTYYVNHYARADETRVKMADPGVWLLSGFLAYSATFWFCGCNSLHQKLKLLDITIQLFFLSSTSVSRYSEYRPQKCTICQLGTRLFWVIISKGI